MSFGDLNESHPDYPLRHRKKDRSGNILPDKISTPQPIGSLNYQSYHQQATDHARNVGDLPSIVVGIGEDKSFQEMDEIICTSAAVFQSMGVTKESTWPSWERIPPIGS